jgi:hypothetical protein
MSRAMLLWYMKIGGEDNHATSDPMFGQMNAW